MDLAVWIQAAAAVLVLAWLPGYAWTRALRLDLSRIERSVLSVVLSIALVTLAIVLGDLLFGVRVSGTNAMRSALGLTAAALAPWLMRRLRRRGPARATTARGPHR